MDHFDHRGLAQPRSLVVIVGGLIACGGIIWGLAVTTDAYHWALTTGEPQEMEWHDLVEHGLFDNAHVQLSNVRLESGVRFDQLRRTPAYQSEWPLVVLPEDGPSSQPASLVVVAAGNAAVQAARTEVEAHQTLTGRFRPTRDRTVQEAVSDLIGLPLEMGPLYGQTLYSFQPTTTILSLSRARRFFYGSVLLTAVGLVICGSGAPSTATSILWCIPSAFSLGGYPLRNGRANDAVRLLYLLGGAVLLYIGYRQLFYEGRIQLLSGSPLILASGFLCLSAGAAACLGAANSFLIHRYGHLLPWHHQDATREFAEAVCDMPIKPRYSRRYVDPKFTIATEIDGEAPFQRLAETLESVDFESPLVVEVVDDDRVLPTTIQVGCGNMAMAVIEVNDGKALPRLVSILDDGFAVITLAKDAPHTADVLAAPTGTYQVAASNDPVNMLSGHLDFITATAEDRGTSVLTVESSEWREIFLYAHRVLAEIRHRHGETDRAPEAAVYGRFEFPLAVANNEVACSA